MSAATVRRRAARLLSRLGVLRYFEAQAQVPYGDSVGEDLPSVAGPAVRFRAAVSSLKTGKADELRSILSPTDFRVRLESPPDEKIWITEVQRDGSALPGAIPSTIVGTPRPSAESAFLSGIGLTVFHTTKGTA